MNSLELMLVDLVAVAESPLYSAYRWLGRRVGRQLSLHEFLGLLDELAQRDVLRLWEVDYRSHDRTELFRVPESLEERYRAAEGLDDRFDPFGLSLTLGAAADREAVPEWEIDFDFNEGRFDLMASAGADNEALKEAARYLPDVQLVPTEREPLDGRVHVVGRID